ncbi:MAG: tyrosine protein phosphatase [Thermodesulfovibrio sp.]|nr:tyrosine protein phosphatase [Thermodesulfovibrio sp.]
MIDIHCHILPGLDDGPETLEESLALCRAAAADGIRTIVATPHYKPGAYEWSGPEVLKTLSLLNTAVAAEGLDLQILPGAEVAVFPELPSVLEAGGPLMLNQGIYFLVEFRPHAIPANSEAFLASFLDSGLIPVIAHPERNAWFANHPEVLFPLVRRGVLLQITAASLTGGLGPQARDFSGYLLRHNLAHVIASDGHNLDDRPVALSKAVALAADLVGEERAVTMVTTVPEAILAGRRRMVIQPLEHALPEEVRPPSLFQRFVRGIFR